jgi:septal ring factor EnvC (AmiA/AmiB activator)
MAQTIAEDAAPSVSQPVRPQLRKWLLGVIWVLALVVIASLFWVIPQAAQSRNLTRQADAASAQLAAARRKQALAGAQLASLRADLSTARASEQALLAQTVRNSRSIRTLRALIRRLEAKLQAERAVAAAAAAAASQASTPETFPYSIPPPTFSPICVSIPCE